MSQHSPESVVWRDSQNAQPAKKRRKVAEKSVAKKQLPQAKDKKTDFRAVIVSGTIGQANTLKRARGADTVIAAIDESTDHSGDLGALMDDVQAKIKAFEEVNRQRANLGVLGLPTPKEHLHNQADAYLFAEFCNLVSAATDTIQHSVAASSEAPKGDDKAETGVASGQENHVEGDDHDEATSVYHDRRSPPPGNSLSDTTVPSDNLLRQQLHGYEDELATLQRSNAKLQVSNARLRKSRDDYLGKYVSAEDEIENLTKQNTKLSAKINETTRTLKKKTDLQETVFEYGAEMILDLHGRSKILKAAELEVGTKLEEALRQQNRELTKRRQKELEQQRDELQQQYEDQLEHQRKALQQHYEEKLEQQRNKLREKHEKVSEQQHAELMKNHQQALTDQQKELHLVNAAKSDALIDWQKAHETALKQRDDQYAKLASQKQVEYHAQLQSQAEQYDAQKMEFTRTHETAIEGLIIMHGAELPAKLNKVRAQLKREHGTIIDEKQERHLKALQKLKAELDRKTTKGASLATELQSVKYHQRQLSENLEGVTSQLHAQILTAASQEAKAILAEDDRYTVQLDLERIRSELSMLTVSSEQQRQRLDAIIKEKDLAEANINRLSGALETSERDVTSLRLVSEKHRRVNQLNIEQKQASDGDLQRTQERLGNLQIELDAQAGEIRNLHRAAEQTESLLSDATKRAEDAALVIEQRDSSLRRGWATLLHHIISQGQCESGFFNAISGFLDRQPRQGIRFKQMLGKQIRQGCVCLLPRKQQAIFITETLDSRFEVRQYPQNRCSIFIHKWMRWMRLDSEMENRADYLKLVKDENPGRNEWLSAAFSHHSPTDKDLQDMGALD